MLSPLSAPSPALALCPHELMRLLAHVYLHHGQPAPAAILFDALHALDPSDTHAARSLALSRLRCGQPEAALAALQPLTDAGDDAAVTHVLRAQALHAAGRWAESALAMRAYLAVRTASEPAPSSIEGS